MCVRYMQILHFIQETGHSTSYRGGKVLEPIPYGYQETTLPHMYSPGIMR